MLFVDQFTSPMILVLIAAAVVTLVIGHSKDTVVILAIVAFNGAVGFVQEYRAGQAMDALKQMSSPQARVVRGGEVTLVPAAEVVPGDVVLLEQGDVVTADMRLLEAPGLKINEAPLTGESEPVAKVTEPLPEVGAVTPADQRNMAFSGTAVTLGRARGLVVSTGMSTAIGRIAELLQEGEDEATPLQVRLGQLGKWLAIAAIAICAVVFGLGVARGEPAEQMFLVAVSLAVAAIPEGLPAVVTISLALGARRMAGRHALVRRLPAVETLGSVSVICTDKTGTLTENRMLVERLWTPNAEYEVSGDGYSPDGTLTPSPSDDPLAIRAAHVAAACNDATLVSPDGGGDWAITGDPTEGALLAFAAKLGVVQRDVNAYCPRVAEVSFDSERRRMTTVHRARRGQPGDRRAALGRGQGRHRIDRAAAGGDQARRSRDAREVAERYARRRLPRAGPRRRRHRCRARRARGRGAWPATRGHRGHGRSTARSRGRAIAAARAAGITPVMITGDHQLTATSIARRLGILDDGRECLTGAQLAELCDERVGRARDRTSASTPAPTPSRSCASSTPGGQRGAIVAMTGDGVNDAPALRRADIGVAMGITGTDVSKEAADMVLADDDFATIVAAVEEGGASTPTSAASCATC